MMPEDKNCQSGQFSSEHLNAFVTWLDENGFQMSPKIEIRQSGSLSNMGTFAKAPITAGELLFSVPRSLLISASTSSLAALLTSSSEKLGSASGWLPLILAVMQERLTENSKWRPYLHVAPNFGEHRLPLQWSPEDRQRLLEGTQLFEEVEADLKKMEQEWKDVLLPFVRSHKDVFAAPEFQDFEFFKDTVAFIIAYSFTEPSDDSDDEEEEEEEPEKKAAPFMVPMADMLNHSASNNAEVQYKPECLEVRAILDIDTGEEIFNTYGELSNGELLRNHGFALTHSELREAGVDTVPVPLCPEIAPARLTMLREAGILSQDSRGEAVFGPEGCVNAELAGLLLAVAAMPEDELQNRSSDPNMAPGAWLADLEEEDEAARDFLGCQPQFHRLPGSWVRILRSAASRQLKVLPRDSPPAKRQRELFAARVQESHRNLLQSLLASLPPA